MEKLYGKTWELQEEILGASFFASKFSTPIMKRRCIRFLGWGTQARQKPRLIDAAVSLKLGEYYGKNRALAAAKSLDKDLQVLSFLPQKFPLL